MTTEGQDKVPQLYEFPMIPIRDYFAAAALTGILTCPDKWKLNGRDINKADGNMDLAFIAYGLADAMLKARKEGV